VQALFAPEIEAFMQFGETFPSLLQLEALSKTPRKGKDPNIAKCNDTVLNVNIFLKKLCIREQIECVDAYELFTKQGNVLKSHYILLCLDLSLF
jgi:hypothetical protein